MTYAQTPYGLNGRPRPAFGRAGAKTAPKAGWPVKQRGTPEPNAEPDSAPRPAPVFYADGSFGISRIFGRMFSVIGSDFVTFFALVALFAIPERIASYVIGTNGMGALLVSKFILSIAGFGLQLAIIHLASRRFAGAPAAFGACAVKALKTFFPALLLGILSAIACAGATLLLIVPGIMLMIAWSLVLPVYMTEEGGLFAAFGRSSALTKGHRWKMLGLFLLLGFGLGLIGFVLMPIWGGHGVLAAFSFINSNWLMRLLISASTGLMLAAIYHEVTGAKEADAF